MTFLPSDVNMSPLLSEIHSQKGRLVGTRPIRVRLLPSFWVTFALACSASCHVLGGFLGSSPNWVKSCRLYIRMGSTPAVVWGRPNTLPASLIRSALLLYSTWSTLIRSRFKKSSAKRKVLLLAQTRPVSVRMFTTSGGVPLTSVAKILSIEMLPRLRVGLAVIAG